ncbi:TatD family hydrolase [Jonesia quinghaiensis]|uniref:TatD family hydrolase n=1 Tax=Jonesia quinghaiensis TaxID=262806 RepID=UPI000405645D|nr:TatD family hydrolase [Jonesia quinghaiensis]
MAKKRDLSWPDAPETLPAPVIDNHTHLESIPGVLTEAAPDVGARGYIDQAVAVNVTRMVQVGCDLPGIATTDELVTEHRELLGAIAIHPNETPLHARTADTGPDGLEPHYSSHHSVSLDDALATVAGIAAKNPRIRAIGETGLDYFRAGPTGIATQRQAFRDHIALAKELNLALQIHDRDAHEDVIEILLQDGAPDRTVFHCYSGDTAMAQVAAEHGWYLSFAGPVTFRANDELRSALRVTPPSRVLVETDAPYLTPHPHRGRPNAPYLIPLTMGTIADQLDVSLVDACRQVESNTLAVYGTW